jgi:hypothetical protein
MIRIFFERLIDWDWPDAPRRNPILHGDIPPRPEPLPKFLDDRDAARLMAAARACSATLETRWCLIEIIVIFRGRPHVAISTEVVDPSPRSSRPAVASAGAKAG